MKHAIILLSLAGLLGLVTAQAEDPQRLLERGLGSCNTQYIAEAVRLGANGGVEFQGRPAILRCVRVPAIVAFLLSAGADVNAANQEYGTTALMEAARSGPTRSVELLLARGAAPEKRSATGVTALMYAAENADGYNSILRLLTAGADVNAADRFGKTPLMRAARSGHAANMQALLQAGADPHAKDTDGRAVVWSAVESGHLAVLQMLAREGVDIDTSTPITLLNPANPTGVHTPLMAAVSKSSFELAQLLLELGAKPQLRNIIGQTALEMARARGSHGLVKLLEDAQ